MNDVIVCHNRAIPTHFTSAGAANLFAFVQPESTPIYICNPEDLYFQPENCIQGVGSPTTRVIYIASMLRRGITIVNGYGVPWKFTAERQEQILFKSELEIKCEIIRRNEYSTKPSRITSIYLVDNSSEGKEVLSHVFSALWMKEVYKPFIFAVKPLVCLKYHKGDVQWLDAYTLSKDDNCIRSYWNGDPMNKNAMYEYLAEGLFWPAYRGQVEEFRKVSEFGQSSKNHWIDLYNSEYATLFSA